MIFNAGLNPEVKRLDLAEAAISAAEKICGQIRFVVLRGDTAPEKVVAMLNGSNCLLMTSDYEGAPTMIQESIACNLPVVSVNVGDVQERLTRVQPSRIVKRDPLELGKAVAEMALSSVRSNGGEVVQEISLDTLRTKIANVYLTAVGREQQFS